MEVSLGSATFFPLFFFDIAAEDMAKGVGDSTSGDSGLVDGDRVGNSTEAEKCEDTGGGFSRSPDQSGTKAQNGLRTRMALNQKRIDNGGESESSLTEASSFPPGPFDRTRTEGFHQRRTGRQPEAKSATTMNRRYFVSHIQTQINLV